MEVGGQQYVPLAALKEERQKRQALEPKAARVDELETYFQQKQPVLSLIEQYPDLLRRPEPVAPPPDPQADPEALEAAQLMDFYTAEGKPDVAKGAKWLALQDRRANRITQQAVQPITQQTLQERANANFQLALQVKDAAGRPINQQALRAVWQQVANSPNGVAILADKQAAAFVASAAHGAMALANAQPEIAPPAKAPIVTETPGAPGGRRAPISELESQMAKERGKNNDQWASLLRGHQPGRPNVVED